MNSEEFKEYLIKLEEQNPSQCEFSIVACLDFIIWVDEHDKLLESEAPETTLHKHQVQLAHELFGLSYSEEENIYNPIYLAYNQRKLPPCGETRMLFFALEFLMKTKPTWGPLDIGITDDLFNKCKKILKPYYNTFCKKNESDDEE